MNADERAAAVVSALISRDCLANTPEDREMSEAAIALAIQAAVEEERKKHRKTKIKDGES